MMRINSKSIIIVLFLALTGGLLAYTVDMRKNPAHDLLHDISLETAGKIVVKDLIDHTNNPFNFNLLEKHWTFVFFGFTSCPDICPATLAQLALLHKKLKSAPITGMNPQFLFVSVDPERDTLSHLAGYVQYFDRDFIGLSGDLPAITEFEKQFGAFHRYDKKNSKGFYTVQHSADIFLVNPNGQVTAKFIPPLQLDRVTKQLALLVRQFNENTA